MTSGTVQNKGMVVCTVQDVGMDGGVKRERGSIEQALKNVVA